MSNYCEPNFFIIGAAKAATTSLSSLLDLHPQAGIAHIKEPHFFSMDGIYSRGWEQYLKLFNHCTGKKAVGEASTSYSRIRYYGSTVERIYRRVPEAKIIYMVRHPIKRMESAYVEHVSSPGGGVFTSINDAVRRQPMIVDSSRYWEVFDTYRQKFCESKIKIVWFEDYIANTTPVFQDICRFLEIDDSVVPDINRQRTNNREEQLWRMNRIGRGNLQLDTAWNEETRRWVIDQIKDDIRRFLNHFGRSPEYWDNLC